MMTFIRALLPSLFLAAMAVGCVRPTAHEPADTGERLFQDKALSVDGTTACASCHKPAAALADRTGVSRGVFGRAGARNAPSLFNLSDRTVFFWDGRTRNARDALLQPFTNQAEMGLGSKAELVARVATDPDLHWIATTEDPEQVIAGALMAYIQRATAAMGRTPYERYAAGEAATLPQPARRGLALFVGRGGCSECHAVDHGFTDGLLHAGPVGAVGVLGAADLMAHFQSERPTPGALPSYISTNPLMAQLGAYLVTGDPADVGAFRTPSLLEVGDTPPYFHDGSVPTLNMAVTRELHDRAKTPAAFDQVDISDLEAFLKALSAGNSS